MNIFAGSNVRLGEAILKVHHFEIDRFVKFFKVELNISQPWKFHMSIFFKYFVLYSVVIYKEFLSKTKIYIKFI